MKSSALLFPAIFCTGASCAGIRGYSTPLGGIPPGSRRRGTGRWPRTSATSSPSPMSRSESTGERRGLNDDHHLPAASRLSLGCHAPMFSILPVRGGKPLRLTLNVSLAIDARRQPDDPIPCSRALAGRPRPRDCSTSLTLPNEVVPDLQTHHLTTDRRGSTTALIYRRADQDFRHHVRFIGAFDRRQPAPSLLSTKPSRGISAGTTTPPVRGFSFLACPAEQRTSSARRRQAT